MYTNSISKCFHLRSLTSALLLLSLGCGTWAKNPETPEEGGDEETKAEIVLDIQGNTDATLLATSLPVTNSSGSREGSLSLTTAQLVLKDIEFRAEDGSENADLDFEGPFIVDLLTNSVRPDPGSAKVNPGDYKEIRLKVAKLEEDDAQEAGIEAPTNLLDKSIYLKGTYSDGDGRSKTFTLNFKLDEEFRISRSSAISLASGSITDIVITFGLARWFDLSNEETNSDKVDFSDVVSNSIVLDEDSEDSEKDLLEVIKDNIKASADFLKGNE